MGAFDKCKQGASFGKRWISYRKPDGEANRRTVSEPKGFLISRIRRQGHDSED
jgi:hypothetical protein